jgi:ribosomal protein S18 acetylase RimI-like enzyme
MELADRGHAAMADRFRLGAEIDGGEAVATPDGLLYAWRSDFPVMLNGAVVLGGDPGALAGDARVFFADRGRGFTLFTRSGAENEAAEAAGMHLLIERYPAMVLHERLAEPLLPQDVSLRRVSSEDEACDYLQVADAAFVAIGMPAGVLGDFRPAALLGEETAAFVAYLDGRAVAAASVVLARGIGGIQWVGVLEEARGRGLAALCTATAANAGFELGADCAWLEASHMGEPVYLRMGFEEVYSYRIYVAPPPEMAA